MKSTAVATTTVILIVAAAVALAAMIHGAGTFEWNWFYPWVIGPYIVLFVVFGFPLNQLGARALAGSVTAVLVLLFTCWFYIGAMWFSVSSTSALIFIFAPVYLLGGGLVTWRVAWFLLARKHKAQ